MNIICGQIFGIMAFMMYIVSMQKREKNKILYFQIFAFLLYSLEYFFLKAYTGACVFLFNMIRCTIFYICKKRHKSLQVIILISLCFFMSLYTCKKIIDVIPIFATLLGIIFTWQKSGRNLRIGQIGICVLWIIYNALNNVYIRNYYRVYNYIFCNFCNIKI